MRRLVHFSANEALWRKRAGRKHGPAPFRHAFLLRLERRLKLRFRHEPNQPSGHKTRRTAPYGPDPISLGGRARAGRYAFPKPCHPAKPLGFTLMSPGKVADVNLYRSRMVRSLRSLHNIIRRRVP